MDCSHSQSSNIRCCKTTTALGYQQYRCRSCGHQYNERTGTTLNFIEYLSEVVVLTVHYYYRFRNSVDDVVELMAMRGFILSHQTAAFLRPGCKISKKRQR